MKGCCKRTYSLYSGPVGIIVTAILIFALFGLAGCLADSESEHQPAATASSSETSSSSEITCSSSDRQPEAPESSSSAPESSSAATSFSSNMPSSETETSSSEEYSSSVVPESSSEQQPEVHTYSQTVIDGISIFADSSFFMEKFHSPSVRIAFKDDETNELNYIEIDGSAFRHEIIPTPAIPNHPQFSPDGSKLAFSSQYEGSPLPSELYVIDLSSAERKFYKLDVGSAAIPRWRIQDNGDTAILYNDFTGSNQDTLWNLSGTYIVTYSNNSFGTPQKAFNRSYNGGISSDNSLAVTGMPRLLFHYANDSDSVNIDMYNNEQACNASISRDSNKIISFLEAHGAKGVQFTQNQNYNWHQYIFYMDSTGKFLKAIKADDGYVFNGTEWLYVSGFQISTMTSANDLSESIALVDYEMGSYRKIITAPGKEITYPDLWVREQ